MEKFYKILENHIKARATLINILSAEEERIISELSKMAFEKPPRPVFSWDVRDGFVTLSGGLEVKTEKISKSSLVEGMLSIPECVVYVKDFAELLSSNLFFRREIQNLAQEFKYKKKTIIFNTVPGEDNHAVRLLENDIVTVKMPLPSEDDLSRLLDEISGIPNLKCRLNDVSRRDLIRAAQGLTQNQATHVFAQAVVNDGCLGEDDVQFVIDEKRKLLQSSQALEFFNSVNNVGDIGGMSSLKKWLEIRKTAFSEEAVKYGIKPPKGLVLLGIPGTGKSLAAEVIASMWHRPLLRFDFGSLFGKWVGDSESNVRKALSVVESIAPCVLWIDEIEKAMSSGDGDSGTTQRVMATFLTWMQEKTADAFIVATANDVSKLPPELLRRGRFDEIFFVDIPNEVEREQIFAVHISKRGRKPSNYDLHELSLASDGFVGAEIEQAIIDAMFHAFSDAKGCREFSTDDICTALKEVIPLSKSAKEKIDALRLWVKEGRAKSAGG